MSEKITQIIDLVKELSVVELGESPVLASKKLKNSLTTLQKYSKKLCLRKKQKLLRLSLKKLALPLLLSNFSHNNIKEDACVFA